MRLESPADHFGALVDEMTAAGGPPEEPMEPRRPRARRLPPRLATTEPQLRPVEDVQDDETLRRRQELEGEVRDALVRRERPGRQEVEAEVRRQEIAAEVRRQTPRRRSFRSRRGQL